MRNIILAVLVVFISLSLSGCWFWAGTALGGMGGYYIGHDDRPTGVLLDDAGITAKVKSEFIKDKDIDALDIDVDTYDGVVHLYGHVDSRWQADKAVQLARSVKGVVAVEPHLEIMGSIPDTGGPYPDYYQKRKPVN